MHKLFTVKPLNDFNMEAEALNSALSYIARARLETILTDTASAAKAEVEKNGAKVWPLEYLPSKPMPPVNPVVESEPLALRASALLAPAVPLAPAMPELAPFLTAIFGETVIVQTKEDAHAFRRSSKGKGVKIVALDGEVIDGDGAFGGPSRVFTAQQQGARFAIGA